jgi:cation transporter-like permease
VLVGKSPLKVRERNFHYMKEPKEFDYFKAWLPFSLIATVGAALVGMVIGSFVTEFLGAAGTRVLPIAVLVIALSISYVTFRGVVGKYLFPKIEEDQRCSQ